MSNDNDNIAEGLLVVPGEANYGFLRMANNSYAPGSNDVHVNSDLIKTYKLRPADRISGNWKPPSGDRQKFRSLINILQINRQDPENSYNRPHFDALIPTYPTEQLKLERPGNPSGNVSARVVDLITPIGRGSRMMVVAPPRTGKSILTQDIAKAIQANYKDVAIIVLLIDERPEEVTDMRQIVGADERTNVIASTFDEQPERHIEVAEVVIERAKRLAEMNTHVVILMDSLTRLARAYNNTIPASGRIMSGGLDARTMPYPKKIFGSARNLQDSGSITIVGTALVDTGSKMDDVIFEELKGTGNAEIHLDRRLMAKRIFPCIDMNKSGTRKEELLLDKEVKETMDAARQLVFSNGDAITNMEVLTSHIKKTKSNNDLIKQLKSGK
jgi:transcription termination factor Rho